MNYILCLVIFLIFNTSINSQSFRRKPQGAFSGTLVISVEGGMTVAATDYKGSRPDFIGTGMIEYFFPTFTKSSFGLRILGSRGFISEREVARTPNLFRTTISTIGGGIVYTYNSGDFFFPYLFAGAGVLWFDPLDENGDPLPGNRQNLYNKTEVNYLGELGFRFLVTENLSLNISSGIQMSPNDYWDDSREGTSTDLMFIFSGGISFAFFNEKDSDRDGVDDSKDLCPETPARILVDASGCPRDFDKDGVPDYLDKCSGTPEKVTVDENGCPVDSDKDGVPDYLDDCPDTPSDLAVDFKGCPDDEDKDGIPDIRDKCPGTPFKIKVDSAGCPKDDDLDGVPDFLDKCPKTPAGDKVDRDGCSVKEDVIKSNPETQEIILSGNASFASGSTKILPEAYEELNRIVYSIMDDPSSRWRIEGYTDNIGSDESNRRISLRRAEAVLDYFVSKGLQRTRFQVFGYGEDNPAASNDTSEGRAKNRRVRIVRVN